MDDTFSATVLIKIESYLLGITLAVLILFDVLIAIETAPMRGWSSVITTKQPFWKKVVVRKKLREVLGLTILLTATSGSFSIGLPYANSNWLDHFELVLLPRPCPQFCLVLQISRFSPQPIPATWAP
ncbi:MAG: hypothetical protein M3298_08445 [Thermoproteota archaeon]|nr:hypothetical protein [Thermoproteota archaeon]